MNLNVIRKSRFVGRGVQIDGDAPEVLSGTFRPDEDVYASVGEPEDPVVGCLNYSEGDVFKALVVSEISGIGRQSEIVGE